MDLEKYLNTYQFKINLSDGQEVTFKPISVFQLKQLMVSTENSDVAIDNLIASCAPGVDIENLSLHDRFMLFVELRNKSKGSQYDILTICPKCSSQIASVVDLNKLEVITKNVKNDVCVLDDHISVRTTPMTRKIQKKAQERSEGDDAQATILSNIFCITSIILDGKEYCEISDDDKINVFDKGPQSFYDALVKHIEIEYNFGLNFTHEVKCGKCKHKEIVPISVENFFA
jgi:hypothetical protein